MSYKYSVLDIKQPLGTFYVFKISAFELLQLVATEPYYVSLENNALKTRGIQREFDIQRGREIANYLRSAESALPNSIIIAGNTSIDEDLKWEIVEDFSEDCPRLYLNIPSLKINGTVIDGQHRLFSFQNLSKEEQKKYELLCSLYLDLPNPYQAYLFATINMNQRKVNKSLAYELYGYDLNDDDSNKWSPEKLAVYLTRKLNIDDESVFKGHILLAANSDEILEKLAGSDHTKWTVSTAAMVEGILSTITSNAKRDRDVLQLTPESERDRSKLDKLKSTSPLRKYYLENNDLLIYTILLNFFTASYDSLFQENTILFKTVGVQVQFAILNKILQKLEQDKDISVEYFSDNLSNYFERVKNVNFNDNFFQLSGVGKTRLKNVMLHKMGLSTLGHVKNEADMDEYRRILNL